MDHEPSPYTTPQPAATTYPTYPPNQTQDPEGDAFVGPGKPPVAEPPTEWSTGLFECYYDVKNCIITFLCPCITFGQIAEIVDNGSTSCGTSAALYFLIMVVTGFPWVYSCFYRSKMRAQYSLKESPVNDCIVHFCCEPCALCQEYRQLERGGFDMNIGWHANMRRQGKAELAATTVPPTVPEGMTR